MAAEKNINIDDLVLGRMRKMSERLLHTKIVIPLLKKIGFEYVNYVHGAYEKGKDIIYVSKDMFKEDRLEVCQVKNDKFTSRSGSSTNATAVLTQIKSCRTTEVLNPKTNQKERPQRVVLLTTYPLTDKDTSDQSPLLRELKDLDCQILHPDKFIELVAQYLPEVYEEISLQNQSIKRAVITYLRKNNELSALQLQRSISVVDYYVKLDIAQKKNEVDEILTRAIQVRKILNRTDSKKNRQDDTILAIQKDLYLEICRKFSAMPKPLSELPLITPINKLHSQGNDFVLDSFDLQGFIEKSHRIIKNLKSSDDIKELYKKVNFLYTLHSFVGFVLRSCGFRPLMGSPDKTKELLSKLRIKNASPDVLIDFVDNLCIIGQAGAGKTSLARMIAYHALQQDKKCLYFPCSQIQKNTDIFKSICKFVCSIAPNSSKKSVEKYCKDTNILILDGCDEAVDFDTSLGRKIRKISFKGQVAQRIRASKDISMNNMSELADSVYIDLEKSDLVLNEPISSIDYNYLSHVNQGTSIENGLRKLWLKYKKYNLKIIITTRTSEPLDLSRDFHEVNIVPFNDKQLEQFFINWFHDTTKDCEPLLRFLNHNKYIREICRTPIIAMLLASIYENDFDLPASKTELYSKRFDLLLFDWDRAKSIVPRGKIKAEDKFVFLTLLAYELHTKHKNTFIKDDAKQIWGDKFEMHYPELTINEVLWELRVYNSVIVPTSKNMYNLIHLSFQEYLTAQAIFRMGNHKILTNNYYNSWWKNVLVFYSGLMGDISLLINEILKSHCIEGNQGLLHEMLSEARYTPKDARSLLDAVILEENEVLENEVLEND